MNKIEYRQKAFEILSYVKLRWNLPYIIVREHAHLRLFEQISSIRLEDFDIHILLFLWFIFLCIAGYFIFHFKICRYLCVLFFINPSSYLIIDFDCSFRTFANPNNLYAISSAEVKTRLNCNPGMHQCRRCVHNREGKHSHAVSRYPLVANTQRANNDR